jgi:hypothetical protein
MSEKAQTRKEACPNRPEKAQTGQRKRKQLWKSADMPGKAQKDEERNDARKSGDMTKKAQTCLKKRKQARKGQTSLEKRKEA